MGLKKRIDRKLSGASVARDVPDDPALRLPPRTGRGDAPRIPSAMKAAVVKRFGEPLTVVDDFPTPTPKEGEVLIEVAAHLQSKILDSRDRQSADLGRPSTG